MEAAPESANGLAVPATESRGLGAQWEAASGQREDAEVTDRPGFDLFLQCNLIRLPLPLKDR